MTRVWYVVAGCLLLTLGVGLYFHFKPEPAPTGLQLEAAPAAELKREETVPLPAAAPPRVYKPSAKKKLGLPAAVQADATKHVVDSIKTPADDRPHTVTPVFDSSTGEFTTYDRVDPLPWIAVKTTTHVAAYYGLKNGGQTIRVQGQQELLQFKAVHLEAVANADFGNGRPDTFVGIGARASW